MIGGTGCRCRLWHRIAGCSPSTEDAVDDDISNGLGQRYWAIMSGKRTGGKKEDHPTVDQFHKVMRFLGWGV